MCNVCDEYCVFVLQNKKDKGVINGMAVSKLGMDIAKAESTSDNVQGILLKLLDRIQRESEQQNDERNRRHEAMIEALGDVEKQLSRMDGIMSRMNGSGK